MAPAVGFTWPISSVCWTQLLCTRWICSRDVMPKYCHSSWRWSKQGPEWIRAVLYNICFVEMNCSMLLRVSISSLLYAFLSLLWHVDNSQMFKDFWNVQRLFELLLNVWILKLFNRFAPTHKWERVASFLWLVSKKFRFRKDFGGTRQWL